MDGKNVIIEKREEYLATGVPGLDKLFSHGIPKGSSILVAGGAGVGKTTLCLQILMNAAKKDETCYYMGFKESNKKILQNMTKFGWNPKNMIDSGNLKVKRFLTSEIYYDDRKNDEDIEAMMTRDIDPLLMELEPFTIADEKGFKPDIIVLDSLSALSSTFRGKEQSYRFYVERLFRFFDQIGSTTFLITETVQVPEIFSPSGVEEFLADGVFVMYSSKKKGGRTFGLEVLKMRGEEHQRKIVEYSITKKGVVIEPDKTLSI
jgi:circadian clock protein KaiC